jgi:MerR family transcriptional regulator, copper efflux regulator
VETLSIGQLARSAGVNIETVRYYERRGLLAAPPRTPAGYRQYGAGDLWRLQFIGRAKRLGFSLTEIEEILGDGGDRSAECVLRAAHAKIASVDEQLVALRETRARLEQLVDLCEEGDVDDCVALRLIT